MTCNRPVDHVGPHKHRCAAFREMLSPVEVANGESHHFVVGQSCPLCPQCLDLAPDRVCPTHGPLPEVVVDPNAPTLTVTAVDRERGIITISSGVDRE